MDERLQWNPSPEEVEAILAELRPLIRAMARRQRAELEQLTCH